MNPDDRAIAEANRLYWDGDTSVAGIAEQFDLSRRALYDALQPQPTGMHCDRCGTELEFANRSARRARLATCPACGAEQVIESEVRGDPSPSLALVAGGQPDARGDARVDDLRHRAMVIGGAAIAGVALGTVAALFATRRD